VAPPLRKGRALALQRLQGLLFLVVLLGLVAMSIAVYTKAFTDTVAVTLQAYRIGNQLTKGADVKVRGVNVGEVRSVRATGEGTELTLHLDPTAASRVPADTRAMILPKTLFGEKFVALTFEGEGAGDRPGLTDGAVIAQDRTETARETAEALDNLLPLLQTLEPQTVSTTLNALSSALRGRGDRIGSNLVLARDWLAGFNPELPTLQRDQQGLADFNDTLTAATPDLVSLLDDLSAVNRSLVRDQAPLDRFLRDTTGVAGTLREFTAENEQRFITLARESVPNLQLYERYSPQYPCLLDAIVRANELGETFGGLQPGLHITLRFVENQGGYLPGDEPVYGDDSPPTCFGLEGEPIRPFPVTKEVTDGYCDEYEQSNPDVQAECPRDRGGHAPPGSSGATPFSPASYDRAAVGAIVAPALGVRPDEVPDVAVLLFAPVARGTVVTI
jgi:phospholipid/cholesterol/gamma-HCH transport system substrate-binding protein